MTKDNVWKRGVPSTVGTYIAWLPHKYGGYYLAVIETFLGPDHKGIILSVQGGYELTPQMDQIWSAAERRHYLNRTMFHTTVALFATQPLPPMEVQVLDGSSEIPGLTSSSIL